MPKVSKIKLYIKSQWGEDYEVHYNAKGAPLFSVKGLPEDFTRVTSVCTYGFTTESELDTQIHRAITEYKNLKKTERKVIIYKSSATAELTMNKEREGSYTGMLSGISKKLDSFANGAETASFGITYQIMIEVDHVNKKQYHPIKQDGSLGYARSIRDKEQIMDWSQEREDFFKNIYSSMREMVLKISQFIDKEPKDVALLIESNQKLLG